MAGHVSARLVESGICNPPVVERQNSERRLTNSMLEFNAFSLFRYWDLYNTQINERAVIRQSAVGYCAGKPTEKSRALVVYKFFSCSTNIPCGSSAYKPQKLVVYCLNIAQTSSRNCEK